MERMTQRESKGNSKGTMKLSIKPSGDSWMLTTAKMKRFRGMVDKSSRIVLIKLEQHSVT